ncbi:hypothetical protein C7964_10219 [Loktanella sp. PT4BL]|jgi:hypothetical protein|uniref:hypothetical protein n=1 Tax=Loktanella sp. PT4BL TaxID=2135611 RepID=UPI000D76DF5C|nr:hypothetical protein [Loktanella sp. PT4BL]PXW70136.1 hypothetical protein C7964_10219 [Loktanella sp. PT4BL]
MTPLQDRLLDAHARDDRAALVGLYTEAADAAPDLDAACFYLTHAYIYALEKGDPAAEQLYRRLKAQGRV